MSFTKNNMHKLIVPFVVGMLSQTAFGMDDFSVGPEAFDPKGGHIQGIAASHDALYLTQKTRIVKVDWKGNVLKTLQVQNHTGDITYHDGKLYTAVAVYPAKKEGRIQVFDEDLNLLQETTIDRTIDGIVYLDGVLYVGMGAKEQPSNKPHRVNILGRFDAQTLKEIAPRADFDYGHETKFGFQNITTDGQVIYASFYGAGNAPNIAVFDKDLNIIGTNPYPAYQGFDVVPQSLTGGKLEFIRARNKFTQNKELTCYLEFPKITINK
jgi:hypothetical protein